MNRRGPLLIIEDDRDDQEILQEVFDTLDDGHEIMFFDDGYLAFPYLTETDVEPFIILPDRADLRSVL